MPRRRLLINQQLKPARLHYCSRRLVSVNVVIFSEEDCYTVNIMIKNLYELKGCGAKGLITEFRTKGWRLRALNKLLRKLTHRNDWPTAIGSGRPRSAIPLLSATRFSVRCHKVTALLVESTERRASPRLLWCVLFTTIYSWSDWRSVESRSCKSAIVRYSSYEI